MRLLRNSRELVFFCLAWKESVVVRAYKLKRYYKSILNKFMETGG